MAARPSSFAAAIVRQSGAEGLPGLRHGSRFTLPPEHVRRTVRLASHRMKNYSLKTRVMVTGGAGVLGSHLCERLLQAGCEVLCVDNFFTGARQNIEHLLPNPSFELLRHDITFPLYVEVDQIYNLACPASPVHY